MTDFFTLCCKNPRRTLQAWLRGLLCSLWLASVAHAGSIVPTHAALTPTEDGYSLSAEFTVDLGNRLESAVAHGVPLYFSLDFTLERNVKFWLDEHIVTRTLNYRLAYSSLARQYRLTTGSLHQNFSSLEDALRVIGRIASLPIAEKSALKPGETYQAALRLALDRSQLPKPFQVDAITDRDWQVEAKTLRWKFVAAEAK